VEEQTNDLIATASPVNASASRSDRLFGFIAVCLWLVLWELFARGLPRFLSPPSQFLTLLFQSFFRGEMWPHFWATLQRFIMGMLIGTPPAIWLGRFVSQRKSRRLRWSPLILALGLIPVFSLFPAFIIFFGIGELNKWAAVSWAVFFPAFYSTKIAFRLQNNQPADSTWIFIVLKQSSIVGMLAVLVAELYASTVGIGFMIAVAGATLNVRGFHVAMAAAALMMYLWWSVLSIAEAQTAYRHERPLDQTQAS